MNRILIIDDDKALCELIKRSVQAENIEADFCNTGKEGLQKLREQEYQLVVLDVDIEIFFSHTRSSNLYFIIFVTFNDINCRSGSVCSCQPFIIKEIVENTW